MPATPARALLDATALTSVAAGSGIGTYTRELLAALARRGDVALSALVTAGAQLPPGVERVTVGRRARRPRLEVIEHATLLPVELRLRRPAGAVFHNLGFHPPPGIAGPWVQTLHDLIPIVLDEPDLAALKARWRRFGPRYRRADAVIAVSRHAADEGIRLLGLDPGRVTVVPHGVDARFRPGPAAPAEGAPYLLVVGEFSRRKGFDVAFGILDELADAGYPHRLVVAGRVHPWGVAELTGLHRRARHPGRIELRGFVPDLVALYQGAAAVLITSRYEGFGLPAAEAMACGVPVVAFANSSITEVVDGGGVLVADGDAGAMVAALRRLIDDPAAAAEVRAAGLARAASLTWDRSAELTAGVYRALSDRKQAT